MDGRLLRCARSVLAAEGSDWTLEAGVWRPKGRFARRRRLLACRTDYEYSTSTEQEGATGDSALLSSTACPPPWTAQASPQRSYEPPLALRLPALPAL